MSEGWVEIWHYRKGSWRPLHQGPLKSVKLSKSPRGRLSIITVEHDNEVREVVRITNPRFEVLSYRVCPPTFNDLIVEGLV